MGLVIREVPDIFVTGHVHGHACIDYKGTTLICSSTWQDQTSYQRMLGFQPKPCMLTIVNLEEPCNNGHTLCLSDLTRQGTALHVKEVFSQRQLGRRPSSKACDRGRPGWIETDEMTAIDVHGQIHFGVAETHATLSR